PVMKFGMRSRLKSGGQARLFEFFYELHRNSPGADPVSEFRYCPLDVSLNVLEEWEKRIVEYAMPSWYEFDHLSDSLCSVFTDINSVFTFLFVKYYRDEDNANGLRCLAIVSHHPLFEVFPELLQCLSHLLVHKSSRNLSMVKGALTKLAACDKLRPSATLTDLAGVSFQHFVLRRTAPPDNQLPGLTQCSPLMELFNKVSCADTLVFILAAMLIEKKILFVGKRLRQLSLSVMGLVSLLYPMSWEHLLVPTLSDSNIDHIGCLVPYIFGLAQPLYLANEKQIEANFSDPDFIRVDFESGDIFMAQTDGEPDEPSLPTSLVKRAKKSLKQLQLPAGSKQQAPVADTHFSQTFLRINAELLAPLRALAIRGEPFDDEQYLKLSPDSYHSFLRRLFSSQMFSEFVCRYLTSPQDEQYLMFNRAADEALIRRKKLLPNYRALKKSLLTATGEGAKRAATGTTVAMRSFARHLPSNHSGPRATTLYPGESSNLRQQQQQAPVSKTSTSTDDLVDGGGTSSPPVMTRPRPVTMSGLRNAAIIQSPTDKSSVDSTKIFNTIGNLQRQPPKRPPPPRPPPPKPSSIAAARGSTPPLEAAEDVEQQDDSSSVDDDGDDVSTDSSHELRVSLHLVPTSTAPKLPSAASFDVEDNYSVKGRLASMAFKRSNSLATNRLMLTNGPPPLPPLSSLPDEAPSSPAPVVLASSGSQNCWETQFSKS
ncbi:hypothetical protein BOX15_Mlig015826g3, partial [Macrostomum lignano]